MYNLHNCTTCPCLPCCSHLHVDAVLKSLVCPHLWLTTTCSMLQKILLTQEPIPLCSAYLSWQPKVHSCSTSWEPRPKPCSNLKGMQWDTKLQLPSNVLWAIFLDMSLFGAQVMVIGKEQRHHLWQQHILRAKLWVWRRYSGISTNEHLGSWHSG